MGNVHTVNCVLATENNHNNLPGLMKRTCQRISFKRSGSDKSSSSSNSPPTSPKATTKAGKKYMVLKTMPRCSSFENLSTVLPATKKVDNDPTYLLWKRAFEQRRNKPAEVVQHQLARMRRRVHNMSSAVSGHLTPVGFPAFIRKRSQKTKQSKAKKSLQLPQLHSANEPQQIPTSVQQGQNKLYIPEHLAKPVRMAGTTIITYGTHTKDTTSPSASVPKYTLAPLNLLSKLPQSKQAIVIEQLYRDIKEMESRYDTQMDSYLM